MTEKTVTPIRRCKDHPDYAPDNCPICGTAAEIGETPSLMLSPRTRRKTTTTETAPAKVPRPATPYVLDTKRARSTGTSISVLALTHDEAIITVPKTSPSHKFGALCVEHGEMTTTLARREAHKVATNPKAWCTKCGAEKGHSTSVPRARAALAVKTGFTVNA